MSNNVFLYYGFPNDCFTMLESTFGIGWRFTKQPAACMYICVGTAILHVQESVLLVCSTIHFFIPFSPFCSHLFPYSIEKRCTTM